MNIDLLDMPAVIWVSTLPYRCDDGAASVHFSFVRPLGPLSHADFLKAITTHPSDIRFEYSGKPVGSYLLCIDCDASLSHLVECAETIIQQIPGALQEGYGWYMPPLISNQSPQQFFLKETVLCR